MDGKSIRRKEMKKIIAVSLVSSVLLIGCAIVPSGGRIGISHVPDHGIQVEVGLETANGQLKHNHIPPHHPDVLMDYPPWTEISIPIDKRSLAWLVAYLLLIRAIPDRPGLGIYPILY
jgi:hypothetical protein